MAEAIGGDVGIEGAIYRNTGTNASPTWVLMEHVRDLRMPDSWAEGDVSSRASRFKLSRKTQRTVGVEFGMIHDLNDADFAALLSAYDNKDAAIEILVLNGPIATVGNRGVRAYVQVFSKDENQPLVEGQEVNFVLKPCRYYVDGVYKPPVAYTVAS